MENEDSNQQSINHDISEEEAETPENVEHINEMDAEPSSNRSKSPDEQNEEVMPTPSQDEDIQNGYEEEELERPPSANYVEYTGEESQSETNESTQKSAPVKPSDKICPVDSTLWMSDILEGWDQEFLKNAFVKFGYTPINIKLITERVKSKPYAFIEFETAEIAKKAILKTNGRSIPGDPEKHKFRLSFANLPNQILNEYCLAVSNLSSTVDDAALFKLFGTKYASCRGAKVHVNPDGSTKRSGLIKFSNQTDQQLALVEMNKYSFKGRELFLRLGATKQRGPKNLLSSLQNPMYPQGVYGQPQGYMPGMFPQFPQSSMMQNKMPFSSNDMYRGRDRRSSPSDRDRRRRSTSRDRDRERDRYRRGRERSPRRRRSRSRDRKRRAKDLDDYVSNLRSKELFLPTYFPPYVQDNKPWDVQEYNEIYADQSEECYLSIESSKWSDFYIPSMWKQEDIVKQLYPETLVDT
jgi:RNA recognition motif-containing protein